MNLKQTTKEQFNLCEQVLFKKRQEYAGPQNDNLDAFRKAGALQGSSSRAALAGMMAKHTVSVFDMCQAPIGAFSKEQWEEKITDHINYLILLKQLLYAEGDFNEAIKG